MAGKIIGWSEHECWTCGGSADVDSLFTAHLVATAKRAPDAMGYPVKTGLTQVTVRVPVPRCADCKTRSRADLLILLGGMAGGAALFAGGFWWYRKTYGVPDWILDGDGNAILWLAALIGAIAGGILSVALRLWGRERPAKRRPYDEFPPIAALLARGWRWPSSD